MSASQRDVERLLESQEKTIAHAFVDAIRAVLGAAAVGTLVEMIEAGRSARDIMIALRIDAAAFSPLVEAIRSTLRVGGEFESRFIRRPGAAVRVVFDMRHPLAEQWIQRHSSTLVTNILADQEQAIRTVLQAGMEAGRGPRSVALDVVGRMDRSTGRRTGGIVGLTDPQAQYVVNARRELLDLSPDYFTRARRDRRFDGIVRRAIRDGKPLSAADVDRIVGRYSDRLLNLRGEMIGRTEAHEALESGRMQSYQQAIDRGDVRVENITRTWKTASDPRVRDTHAGMHNQAVVGMDAPFVSPSGARLMFPGDRSLGAPGGEVIACRCTAQVRIDWLAQELG